MKNPWLLLDVSNLAWKAYYSLPKLSHKKAPTQVIFGILKDVILLQERFHSNRIAFCFDLGISHRVDLYRAYKANRKAKHDALDEDEKKAVYGLRSQLDLLRTKYLRDIGFNNIFAQESFEADDIIAALVHGPLKGQDTIIVSSDRDMYQLLRSNVSITQPQQNKIITKSIFIREFGIKPIKWPKVKALMGDPGDNISGIGGVGVKTAIKYIKNDAQIWKTEKQKQTLLAISAFKSNGSYERNYQLVKLPWPGVNKLKIEQDKVTKKKWRRAMIDLGIRSLKRTYPLSAIKEPEL